MSELPRHQRLSLADVAALVPTGGDFVAEQRFAPLRGATFTPWSRDTFKAAVAAAEERRENTPSETVEAAPEPPPARETECAPAAPEPIEPAPTHNPEDILAAIEQAREDGRALGYKQGFEAAQREIHDVVADLRRLESDFESMADGLADRSAEIVARHVRRIAQDLSCALIDEMPEVFVDRIRSAAKLFERACSDVTLAMRPADARALQNALGQDALFKNIALVESDDLPPGAFRLTSAALELEDAPKLEPVA